jgi:putative ATPase
MQAVAEEGKMSGSVILLLDEIHRLDKAKQDFLLPHLENGNIILIGATTSNPYHAINPAIRSRCQIFELELLDPDDVREALERAIGDASRGLGDINLEISDEAIGYLSHTSQGDVRSALNALELAALSTEKNSEGVTVIGIEDAKACMQKSDLLYDKDGDQHYDVMSAFQKSIRGSDVDAALHYLARLVEAGDLVTIARRLLVISYEDIGLANPQLASRTLDAIVSAERLGFPEARIPLSQAVIELSLSPKSNSAIKSIDGALSDIRKKKTGAIPKHLKDSHYKSAEKLGNGIGYKYPHNYPNHVVSQQYLPDPLKNAAYYQTSDVSKYEKQLADIYDKLKKL